MSSPVRVACASVAATGHFLPTLALAGALRARGNEVTMLSPERRRSDVEAAGLPFLALEDAGAAVSGPEDVAAPLARAARAAVAPIRELGADVLISDPFAQAPMLAAEIAGVRTATLVPDPYHVPLRGLPVFAQGLLPPRTALGGGAWRAAWPLAERARRRVRKLLNELRAELGLPALERLDGAISDGLVIVATFPQLEYPREWPAGVEVTGPMLIDLPAPVVDSPAGNDPLVVVVASTTGLEPPVDFIRTALEALDCEPVRVLATVSSPGERWRGPVPANSVVADWLDLAAAMPRARAVVCNGGHGTVARALAAGVPALVCPIGGNTPQIGVRISWAGAGLMLPRRLLGPRALRLAVRRLLGDTRLAATAGDLGAWARANDGPARGAELVERYARR